MVIAPLCKYYSCRAGRLPAFPALHVRRGEEVVRCSMEIQVFQGIRHVVVVASANAIIPVAKALAASDGKLGLYSQIL